MEEAVKFLVPLRLLAADRIETHLMAFDIYLRKGSIWQEEGLCDNADTLTANIYINVVCVRVCTPALYCYELRPPGVRSATPFNGDR